MRFRYVAIAAVSAGLLILPSSASAASTVHVNIVNFAFQNASDSSSTTNIAVGDSIEWDWATADGITPHSTTSDATSTEVWDSGQLTQPSTFTHIFNSAGSFSYHCTVHSFMQGTVVVGDVFQLSTGDVPVSEGDLVQIEVHRLGAGTGTASVEYSTADLTAVDGTDYTGTNGTPVTLNWSAGDVADKTIQIQTLDDGGTGEGDSQFTIALSNPTSAGGATTVTPTVATVTIHENDPPPPSYQPDVLVKGPADASYKGDNVYNTLVGQTSVAKVKKGKSATFFVKVQNDGNVSDSFAVKGKGSTTSFSVRYFHGTTNITRSVVGGTASTPTLGPGKSWTIKAVITPKRAASVGSVFRDVVSAHSMTDTSKKDAVLLKEKVIAS